MRPTHTSRYRHGALVEATIFGAGLLLVAALDPSGLEGWTICPFRHLGELLGVDFCPGCGLGRSVGWLVRGEISVSMATHPLGIPAVTVLLAHIMRLVRESARASFGPRQAT